MEADERVRPRYERDYTVFIEYPPFGGFDEEAEVLICKSVDLSETGLQVAVDWDISVDSILRLCLEIKDREPIFVTAKVMWQRYDQNENEYHLGFMLLESKETDYEDWQRAIAELFMN